MPELPEVETVVRDLRPLVVGQKVVALRVSRKALRRPWKRAWAKSVVGATVEGIRRRGKWIVIDLESNLTPLPPSPKRRGGKEASSSALLPLSASEKGSGGEVSSSARLVVHLGMTGQFTVVAAKEPLQDHTHFVFDLSNGTQLRFRDYRRFGSVEWFPDEATVQAYLADKLGPEPTELEAVAFREALRRTGRTLKAILLDQTVVAGVGNIYADEALHRAGLHPERRGASLTDAEADRLREAVASVIAAGIEHRGSTIRDYVGGSGLRGGYQDEFRVYGRTGEACPACAAVIAVVRVAGRSSHFCPTCQPTGAPAARGESSVTGPRGAPGRRRT